MAKIAIIGAGFTGLAAGVELVDKGHIVVLFEAGEKAGGLAVGFKDKGWKWSLEKFYHHIFANDDEIIRMAKKVGHPAFFQIPVTSVFRGGRESALDSPVSLMMNRELSLWGRIRMAVGLAYLKMLSEEMGRKLEKKTAVKTLPLLVGKEGYEKVWEPLLLAKFGNKVKTVNMAWFWARIAKRTKSLGYFEGGFEKLAEKMVEYIKKKGGEVKLSTEVGRITRVPNKGQVRAGWKVNGEEFDDVILTVPAPLIEKLVGKIVNWPKIEYLWGQTVVVEASEKLMDHYWLNILEKDWPFLVVVEQTNFIGKDKYGGKRLLYIGNYLEDGDKRLSMSEKELMEMFLPYLQKINKKFTKEGILKVWKWQAPFAQPVFPVNYSKGLPKMKAGNGLFIANMSMVYPWDRGTNYAVKLGQEVAGVVE